MSEFSGEIGPEHINNVRIKEAIANLDRLDELPVDEHPAIFDEIHSGLRDALANAGNDGDPALGAS